MVSQAHRRPWTSREAAQMYPVRPHAQGALTEPASPCRACPGLLTDCYLLHPGKDTGLSPCEIISHGRPNKRCRLGPEKHRNVFSGSWRPDSKVKVSAAPCSLEGRILPSFSVLQLPGGLPTGLGFLGLWTLCLCLPLLLCLLSLSLYFWIGGTA